MVSTTASNDSPSKRPLRFLLLLFAMTCYTTFCLPYPQVRPNSSPLPAGVAILKNPVASGALPQNRVPSSPAESLRGKHLLHARASAEAQLVYEQPDLERYYQQEGFSEYPYSKFMNMGALGIVAAWVLYEHVGCCGNSQEKTSRAASSTL